jgi:hypothetical protein
MNQAGEFTTGFRLGAVLWHLSSPAKSRAQPVPGTGSEPADRRIPNPDRARAIVKPAKAARPPPDSSAFQAMTKKYNRKSCRKIHVNVLG